ncbi:MAG TPA: hypothetical protein VFO63_15585 [Blastocatellia bacterium]|nr:hypothetical protein [Blastocatellia bacterium]
MRISRIVLLFMVAVAALAHQSDGQSARPVSEQLRLASITPRGAMVYVQARDLAALMKLWIASSVRDNFYKSKNFAAFSASHAYLKLQDRKKDFETALGFGLDESRLAELAGGASAVAVYDIGKLELVFVTEVARERAIATAMFKQAPQFQERSSAAGVYYVRDVTTDGGRLNQQFCFAHASGKLLVTTSEGLMIRALANAKSAGADSLLADVTATAELAKGFAAHEVTMWLDQTRLNRSRHFNNYWLHRNVASFSNIESGLIDLRITPAGLAEQRWFKLTAGGQKGAALSNEQANALIKFAPADTQLIELRGQSATNDLLSKQVSQALFGKLPDEAEAVGEVPADYSRDTSTEGDEDVRVERYRRLDQRFDKDIDDDKSPRPQPAAATAKAPATPPAERFEKSVSAILANISAAGYSKMVRSKLDAAKPFVTFERAVVIEMGADQAIDRGALERAITSEMRERFVVAGVEPGLVWQDDAQVRYLAQSLLDQGAAYSISGKYLVLASSREFARDILRAAASASTAKVEGTFEYYGVVRVADAKPVFDKLMSKLDGKVETAASQSDDEEESNDIKFFSENMSSFITSTTIREFRARRQTDGTVMVEQIFYSF